VSKLAQLIAKQEGFGIPGAVPPATTTQATLSMRLVKCTPAHPRSALLPPPRKVVDERHMENIRRLEKQDQELKEIRSGLARIEGTLSTQYPKVAS
jgi:hypothetical protein